MKFRAHYTDGHTVDIHSDNEKAASAHAAALEQQELERASTMDPPLKYTKRTLERIEPLEGPHAPALREDLEREPTGSRRRKS